MPKRYWWILATYIICQLSGFLSLTPLLNFIPENQRDGIWTLTIFLVALVIIIILLLPERGLYRDMQRSSLGDAILWAVIGIFLVQATNIVAGIIDHILELIISGKVEGSENTELIMDLVRQSPYVVLAIVIVGPILEEIIFRKIIFGQLYKKTNFWIAGITSSLLFALAHADGHLIIYGSIGLVLCLLYWKTKRIFVSMIAHGSMNAFAVLITFSPAIQKMIEQEQQQQHMSIIVRFFLGY